MFDTNLARTVEAMGNAGAYDTNIKVLQDPVLFCKDDFRRGGRS